MPKHFLPVIDTSRTEFGFARAACSCDECTLNCQHIPGYLIPADLKDGRIFRIPTLVPARQITGSCIFLTADNRCAVHAFAPFGCAFFDCGQSRAQSDQRSLAGLQAVYTAWINGDLYGQVWLALDHAGCQASAPEIARQRLQQALGSMNYS